MHTNRTPGMRFSRELFDQAEWFTAKWLSDGPPPAHVEIYFANAPRLKAWLVTEQQYSEGEADALLAQLRASQDDNPP